MTLYHGLAAFIAVYLVLLARSAWKQGEIRQFLVSLGVVVALMVVLGGVTAGYIALVD